jgi:Flp pilus assembly protein TadG
MTNARAPIPHILRRAAHAGRALSDDARATAAVEAALILPVALTMFALLIYGAEAFAIQRKVTLTARTVTDLITQAAPTQYSGSASVVVHATIDTLLSYASCVMAPYSTTCPNAPPNLSMVVSEVLVNSDQATASVQWSEPYNGATALSYNQKITLPTGMGTGQAGNYFVMGQVYYNYTPLDFYTPAAALTLHDTIYLTPRQSTSITCTDCASIPPS